MFMDNKYSLLVYTSFKRTVHLSDFENMCFPLNACLLSRLFQTGKVQTKAETMERSMRWQGSISKHLIPEYKVRLKEV